MATKPYAESIERFYRYLTTRSTALATTELTRQGAVKTWSDIAEDAILAASTTKPGFVELATSSEITTGTDDTRAITPKGLKDAGFAAAHADEVAASDTVAGIVELAIGSEVTTGTDTQRAVTPKALADAGIVAVAAASDTVAGKVELATGVEAQAVTSQVLAVTPYALGTALAALDIITFTGRNGAGACTATGVKTGDVVFGLAGLTDMGAAGASFESVVTVNDQIQQSSASDLSLKNFVAILYRPVSA